MGSLINLVIYISFISMGLIAIARGEIALSNTRIVKERAALVIGLILIVGGAAPLLIPIPVAGIYWAVSSLVVAIVVGFFASRKKAVATVSAEAAS